MSLFILRCTPRFDIINLKFDFCVTSAFHPLEIYPKWKLTNKTVINLRDKPLFDKIVTYWSDLYCDETLTPKVKNIIQSYFLSHSVCTIPTMLKHFDRF